MCPGQRMRVFTRMYVRLRAGHEEGTVLLALPGGGLRCVRGEYKERGGNCEGKNGEKVA